MEPGTLSLKASGLAAHRELRNALSCFFSIEGHSPEVVGRRLVIATGTVKVHRRNAYRKLGISSQTSSCLSI
jgi:ATP/maltotriose-dependent transcriptional regulator MalT